MSKKYTQQEFLDILFKSNDCYKSGTFQVIGEYNGANNKILLQDKYGIVNVQASVLMRGICYQINSAVDKTSYYINRALEVHGEKYDYLKTKYNKDEKVCVICPIHGEFFVHPQSHLMGVGCYHCGVETVRKCKTFTKESYSMKANKIHNYIYDYSDFKDTSTMMTLNCKKHGDFKIKPTYHLQGTKCPSCTIIQRASYHKEFPTGWKITEWVNAATCSKNFDSFKVYVIRCWNEEEEFYKIGRTYRKTKIRFYGKNMPYNYEVFHELVFENGEDAFYKELDLKKIFKENKYLPYIKFNGMHECFNNIEEFKYD